MPESTPSNALATAMPIVQWANTWMVAGRTDELPGPGHYFTWERTGVPLLVVRSADNEVRAFFNSCRHRGAPVVREARGRNRALRCQYHSWTYDTFGNLVSAPDERDFVDLRFEERALVPVAATVAGDWVLVNQDAGAATPEVPPVPAACDGLVTIAQRSWPIAADWGTAVLALGDVLSEYAPGGQVTPIAPNGLLLRVAADHGVALLAWPSGAGGSEIQAMFLAPPWDEDEDEPPATTAPWLDRFSRMAAAVTETLGSGRGGTALDSSPR